MKLKSIKAGIKPPPTTSRPSPVPAYQMNPEVHPPGLTLPRKLEWRAMQISEVIIDLEDIIQKLKVIKAQCVVKV